jgi:chromosome segregation ATPase
MESESKILTEWRVPSQRLFLGPLFLLISLSLALLKGATFSFPLFLLTALGLVASMLFALRGALVTGLLMMGYFFLFRAQLPEGTHLWHFGFLSTLALALVITALSLETEEAVEEEMVLERPQESLTIQLENRLKLSQEKIERLAALTRESDLQVQSLFRENEALKLESIEQRRQIESLKSEIGKEGPAPCDDTPEEMAQLNEQLQMLVEEKESALKRALSELTSVQHELKLISSRQRGFFSEISPDNLKRLEGERDALLKAVDELEYDCLSLKGKLADEPPDVEELKWQLEEKKEILHQTRAELFRAESDFLSYQRLLGEQENEVSATMAKLSDALHEERPEELFFDDLISEENSFKTNS